MTGGEDLAKSIAEAEDDLRERERHLRNIRPGGKSRHYNLHLIVIMALALSLEGIILTAEFRAEEEFDDDVERIAVDFLLQADEDVLEYHELFGELPFTLPDYSLRSFVQYSRVDDQHYQLQAIFENYDRVLSRTLNEEATLDIL